MSRQAVLFSSSDLPGVLEGHLRQMSEVVAQLPASEVAQDAQPSTVDRLVDEFTVSPLLVHADQVTVEQVEAKVDVSRDPLRDIRNRSQPFYVAGHRVRYFVPYEGDKVLWQCRPSAYTINAPTAEVTDAEIILDFTVQGQSIAHTKAMYEQAIGSVRQWVAWSTGDVQKHNDRLRTLVQDGVKRRHADLEAAAKQMGELGIPVRTAVPSRPHTPKRESSAANQGSPDVVPQQAMDYDVALSFAGEDRVYVEKVAELLRAASVRVFYDKFETAQLWGRNLADHLGDIYGRRARFVVMFISKHYPAKSWPTRAAERSG